MTYELGKFSFGDVCAYITTGVGTPGSQGEAWVLFLRHRAQRVCVCVCVCVCVYEHAHERIRTHGCVCVMVLICRAKARN